MKKYVKTTLIIIGLIITIGALLPLSNPDIYYVIWYKITSYKDSQDGDKYVMPETKEIVKLDISEERFVKFERYNLKFTLPFEKNEISSIKDKDNAFIARCSNNIVVILNDQRDMSNIIIKGFHEDKANYEKSRKLFGDKALESDFEFLKFMLEIESKEIDFSSTKEDVFLKQIANIYVDIMFSKNSTIFYTSEIKGFQSLSQYPDNKAYSSTIYDNKNNQYLLSVSGNEATQEMIDYILSSIESLN